MRDVKGLRPVIAHAKVTKDGKDVAMVQTMFNKPSTPWSTP